METPLHEPPLYPACKPSGVERLGEVPEHLATLQSNDSRRLPICSPLPCITAGVL